MTWMLAFKHLVFCEIAGVAYNTLEIGNGLCGRAAAWAVCVVPIAEFADIAVFVA